MAPKRKRQAAASAARAGTGTDTSEPAPKEAAGLGLTDVGGKEASEGNLPPTKRTRSTSKASATLPSTEDVNDDDDDDEDMLDDDDEEETALQQGGENGEAGKMRMDAPPKGGIVDPVGYKTNPPPTGRPVRVYADGVFDLFHLGHMRQLQQAKTAFPDTHLIVGVTGDRETHRRKGLTVLSGAERAESVRHCKWVDEVIEDCPWVVTPEFLRQHELDYVAHDDIPYGAAEGDDIYAPIKKAGMFLVTQRTEGVSTTGIITKIVRDYESYIARQLQRGQSRKELNISWLKKNELDIKRHVAEIRESIKQNWNTTGQELGREFRQFWLPAGASRPGSPGLAAPSAQHGDAASARGRSIRNGNGASSPMTPATARLAAQSPGAWSRFSVGGARDRDFVAGYAMGLLGSVKGWMQRNRRNVRDLDASAHGMLSPTRSNSGSDDEENRHEDEGDDEEGRDSVAEKLEKQIRGEEGAGASASA